MPVIRFSKRKSDAEIIEAATWRLLKGIKVKAAKEGKPLRKTELQKRGYSKRFIAIFEKA